MYFGTLILPGCSLPLRPRPDYFNYVTGLLGSWPGQIVLFGYTWALVHHMLGGIRHFIWDTGHGFDLKTVDLIVGIAGALDPGDLASGPLS